MAESSVKGLFHAPVFAGMKSQDGHASAGFKARWQIAQKRFQSGELIVHRDAQGLKHAAHGQIRIFLAQSR